MKETVAKPSMGALQEHGHDAGHDYSRGSPHIRHHAVRDRVISSVYEVLAPVLERKGACRALELGAGHGTFTDHLLAAGADVEVTEMSEPSVEVLRHRFRYNSHVSVVHDRDGETALQGGPLDAVVCISVLHHIPDYLGTVKRLVDRITLGGSFLCMQDPLWYPRRSRLSLGLDQSAYLLWRLGQGEARRGIATRLRRLRGEFDETKEADMVEYHVVRQGLDEEALRSVLAARFRDVDIRSYWSTQSGLLQSAGDTLRFPPTTFGIIARDRY